MAEGMAVAIRERSFGRGPQVGKYQGGGGFGRQSFQIDAIPCWNGGREDARFRTEGWRGVVANAKAVAVMGPSRVLEPR